ncbi:hypothetical protein BCR33DRAFT_199191 [Rhizoclosmatium globosum]|uniref:Uncharacterized protein n=1 Tax=Rhizoclosmatium globosum TaxID=329046 RepID=A0A1Y2CE50_9FUNG|nr:hypothetical protein BCR33DRAFT_199191 [Rhizoclosmatium globosum]|eukprot:ORY45338.1 hypothetical protein BCR33DRAFT_199191 [Rhizoclosmatium globosum]
MTRRKRAELGCESTSFSRKRFMFGFNLNSDNNNADADALAAAINNGVNGETFGGDGGAGTDFDFNAGANVVFASNNFFVQPSNLSQRDRLYL